MEKWFVAMKKANFVEIAKKYKISPITARLIRNRDVIGDNPNLILPGQKLKTNLSYNYEEQFRK